MLNKTCIVVPSRERAQWLMNRTDSTPKYIAHLKPWLYVRQDDSQFDAYKAWAAQIGARFLIQKPDALGAAQTYDSLINMCIDLGFERLVILDDDLYFKMQNPIIGAKPEYRKCKPFELTQLVYHFADLTSAELPAASMTPIMKRTQPGLISYAHPLMWTYSFYLPHFKTHPEHRFWQGPHIEARCDLNLSLRILRDGYLTAFMASCFIPDNVNNPGGCSTYRSIELERASVNYLMKEYPDLVRVRKTRGWVGDRAIERDAPIISWKRAFNADMFFKHFNMNAQTWSLNHLHEYEKKYSTFIDSIRRPEHEST